jgi:hypothetical protein
MWCRVADDGEAVGRAWHWLGGNLAVIGFLAGICTGVAGGLFAAGKLFSDTEHRIVDLEQDVARLHADMISVDSRLNAGRDNLDALRAATDRRFADLEISRATVRRDLERQDAEHAARLDVLEIRLQFLFDRQGLNVPRIPPSRQQAHPP